MSRVIQSVSLRVPAVTAPSTIAVTRSGCAWARVTPRTSPLHQARPRRSSNYHIAELIIPAAFLNFPSPVAFGSRRLGLVPGQASAPSVEVLALAGVIYAALAGMAGRGARSAILPGFGW